MGTVDRAHSLREHRERNTWCAASTHSCLLQYHRPNRLLAVCHSDPQATGKCLTNELPNLAQVLLQQGSAGWFLGRGRSLNWGQWQLCPQALKPISLALHTAMAKNIIAHTHTHTRTFSCSSLHTSVAVVGSVILQTVGATPSVDEPPLSSWQSSRTAGTRILASSNGEESKQNRHHTINRRNYIWSIVFFRHHKHKWSNDETHSASLCRGRCREEDKKQNKPHDDCEWAAVYEHSSSCVSGHAPSTSFICTELNLLYVPQ